MRSLTLVTILCLTATPAFACVFDTECKPGTTCVDGSCGRDLFSGSDDVPAKEARRKGRPAVKMVIATQAPVVSRARAPRVFA